MNSLIAKYRPEDQSKEDFEKFWEAAGYTFEPVARVLQEMIDSRRALKESDFEGSGAIGIVAFKAGEAAMAQKILDLLPSSAKSA